LTELGLELIDDKKGCIIEKIKMVVVDMVHHSNEKARLKNSEYISGNAAF
jgi:Rad3-related DNA helicase